MQAPERAELKRVINILFKSGPNKVEMFEALENFIDRNYLLKHGPMKQFVKDMDNAGSYKEWKRGFARVVARMISNQDH